jgi:hypothetical protein
MVNVRFQSKHAIRASVPFCPLPEIVSLPESLAGVRVAATSKADGGEAPSSRLGWPLTVATALALVLIAFTAWAFWTIRFHPEGIDFVSFWSAGRMVVDGDAAAAYDIAAHRALELTVAPGTGLMPFPYPPPFLLIVAPFALASFATAFMLWDLVGAAFYIFAGRRVAPAIYVLANPPVLVAMMIGQSSLFTAGILILGLTLVANSPILAGAVLGLLIVKPQLALMLPVAMVAGRQWRTIAGALLSSLALLLLALLLLGIDSYRGFFAILPTYTGFMQRGSWDWATVASPFGFARYFGAGFSIAIAVQAAFALAAATVTAIAWAKDWEQKVPILAAATLLATPYLFTYDAILLLMPAGVLIRQQRFGQLAILWVLATLPVLTGYNLYAGPNTIPLACLFSISLMAAPDLKSSRARPAPAQGVAA